MYLREKRVSVSILALLLLTFTHFCTLRNWDKYVCWCFEELDPTVFEISLSLSYRQSWNSSPRDSNSWFCLFDIWCWKNSFMPAFLFLFVHRRINFFFFFLMLIFQISFQGTVWRALGPLSKTVFSNYRCSPSSNVALHCIPTRTKKWIILTKYANVPSLVPSSGMKC